MANSTDLRQSALLSMTQVQKEATGVVHSGCVLVLQDVNEAFEELEEGNEDALKVRCIAYLNHWNPFWACIDCVSWLCLKSTPSCASASHLCAPHPVRGCYIELCCAHVCRPPLTSRFTSSVT